MALKESKEYYTASQVKNILGITDGMLYNYVDNGALERVIPPGKKQGVYRRNEVDRLKIELQTFIVQKRKKHTKIMRVTSREEMIECMEISQALFGVGRDEIDDRMKILEKNPDTYYLLRDEDQIIGYFSIMPLKVGNLNDVLKQTLPVKIDFNKIESFDQGKVLDLYLTAIGVKPGFSNNEKHIYGSRLLAELIELILELGKKGIVIENIAARSNMPDGIRLIKHMGFTEIPPLTPERRTFIIRVKESGIPYVLQYKRFLEESQAN